MGDVLKQIFQDEFIRSSFRLATPILFAALGAVIADKSGITNIGLEGIMLFAALFGVLGSAWTQSLAAGMLIGLAAGMAISALLGFCALYLKTDVILTGIIVNLLGAGGTIFLLQAITGDKNVSTSVQSLTFPQINIPLIEKIPVLGAILSGHNLLTYLAVICIFGLWFLLNKTHFGVKIRAAGENPLASSSMGINVRRVKMYAITLSGMFASLGGMFMSMAYVSNFAANMTAGRGFIALAAEAIGVGHPAITALYCLLFGITNALAIIFGSVANMPVLREFINILPYIITIVSLIVYSIIKNKKRKKI